MIRLLIDYTWVYLIVSFAIIFVLSYFAPIHGAQGWFATFAATIAAGRFHATRVGTKLDQSITWNFGVGTALITLVIMFAQILFFLEPRAGDNSNPLFIVGIMLVPCILLVFGNQFMINRIIGNALSEKA